MHGNRLYIKRWRDKEISRGNEGGGQDKFGSSISGGNNKGERK